MGPPTESKIRDSGIGLPELISHHRIMHDAGGYCEGVMNKPCNSGCESFKAE